jgi:hypothetical protein
MAVLPIRSRHSGKRGDIDEDQSHDCRSRHADRAAAGCAGNILYPSQGQAPEQQSKDRAECQVWAQQQTGVDPTRPAPQVAAAPAQQGQVVRGAARGGLLGVVGSAIGGNVGKGPRSGRV